MAEPEGKDGAFQQHMDRLARRMDYAHAEAAQHYDEARTALKKDHADATDRQKAAQATLDTLGPQVDAVANGDRPLSKAGAQRMLAYLKAAADAGDAGQAQRMAYGATQPPGTHAPGQGFE